jgi:hypothetical protein
VTERARYQKLNEEESAQLEQDGEDKRQETFANFKFLEVKQNSRLHQFCRL